MSRLFRAVPITTVEQIVQAADRHSVPSALLGSICTRYHRTGRIGATGEELKAIEAGIDRHEIQLMYTTGLDLKKAGAALEQLKAQARAGRMPSLGIKHAEATT